MHFYNDISAHCCAALEELMKAGLIPPGQIDNRSIESIQPDELQPYRQCHFFAGISGWPIALQLAGWPADEPCWTGSCPCQPFSTAGARRGTDDPRHLWPHFRRLIADTKPPTVLGEQVAGDAGREWLSGVRADLEALAYEVGGADLCAAGVGAPHIRQRLYWVAHAQGARCPQLRSAQPIPTSHTTAECSGDAGGLADPAMHGGPQYGEGPRRRTLIQANHATKRSGTGGAVDSSGGGCDQVKPTTEQDAQKPGCSIEPSGSIGRLAHAALSTTEPLGPFSEHLSGQTAWSNYATIQCTDGKARRIESGSFPLADGFPGRVGALRAYGNAIVPQVAARFIQAFIAAKQ